MSNKQKSLYDILGVKSTDSSTDIKKAYLKLARIHHPDKGGDPEQFKEICNASEILTDEKKRRIYDETGMTDGQLPENNGFPSGFTFPFEVNFNDLFGGMFGNPQVGPQRGPIRKNKKPQPAVQTIPLTLEQFYLGHQFDIHINRQSFCVQCEHTGAKSKELCKQCNGAGSITQVVQMGRMTMHTVGPCLGCQGKGEHVLEICNTCTGTGFIHEKRNLSVKIIPGTKSQETFIFPEVCSDNPAFERPGDVHIVISENYNDPAFKDFKRTGDQFQHLETVVTISLSESLLGCTVRLDNHPGYDEGLFIKIPPASFQNDKYCLNNCGMPLPGNIGKYGDLFVTIHVSIKPNERALLKSQGSDILSSLFKDNIRTLDCSEDEIHSELFLCK